MSSASILIVEDEVLIARDLTYLLEDLGYSVPAVAATSEEALAAIAAARPDLVLLDIRLADDSNGFTVAEWLQEHDAIPVIFLTAHADEATIAHAQATSPYGYILKPFNERELTITVQLALAKSASDRQLQARERLFATILRSIDDGVIVTDTAHQVTYLNPRAEQISGWSAEEALGQPLPEIFLIQGAAPADPAKAAGSADVLPLPPGEALLVVRDGVLRPIENTVAPIKDERGSLYGIVVAFRDVTERHNAEAERRRLERKMLETQRLESLGILAGGIAHDFNNILTSVLGYVQLTEEQLAPGSEALETLRQACYGLQRAGDLTAQLLTYAGHGHSVIRPILLNTIVRDLTRLLRGRLANRVSLTLELSEELPLVLGDVTQLNQVILNLLTNALEALGEEPGTILVRTEELPLTPAQAADMHLGEQIVAGPYVCVTVRDSGCGIGQDARAKIFEPFFTTKRDGHGLGLAAVYGIVRAHGGAIDVDSAPGAGTTFRVYLPVSVGPIAATAPPVAAAPGAASAPAQQCPALLVIDDEPEMRAVLMRMLERLGFRVYSATDGAAGLALLAADGPQIDGVFLDLTMPGISGPELMRAICQLRPALPIALMSGYAIEEVAARHSELRPRCFLQKPITRATLDTALRILLGPETAV
jgi:PAS domain S-box-containing protein